MATKELLPLVLSIKAANWRMNDDDSEAADAEFKLVRTKVLQRDEWSCRFCGFRAIKWQEVHHLNDDHADNRPDNLVTTCNFCHMCQHIGRAGKFKEATMAWLPELSQVQVNHLVRAALVTLQWADTVKKNRKQRSDVVAHAGEMEMAAKACQAKLVARSAECTKRFLTCDPAELGDILGTMAADPATAALYDTRASFTNGLRLVPLGVRMKDGKNIMGEVVDTWLAPGGPYAALQPNTWLSVVRNMGTH